jgi:hypothetical protein
MISTEEESWVPVLGWEGYYEVSNFGRVRSVDRLFVNSLGRVSKRKGVVLRYCTSNTGGYCMVRLRRVGFSQQKKIHSLVLISFVGPPGEGQECRHLDGVRTNNRLDNLSWGTRLQNRHDRMRHGTNHGAKGSSNRGAILTEDQVREIRRRHTRRYGEHITLAAEYGVSACTIQEIMNRRTWTHLED